MKDFPQKLETVILVLLIGVNYKVFLEMASNDKLYQLSLRLVKAFNQFE
jgi:hypothetical protein